MSREDYIHFLVNENNRADSIQEINDRIDFAEETIYQLDHDLEISHIYIGAVQRRIIREVTPYWVRATDYTQTFKIEHRGITMHELSYQKSHWYIALKKK